MLTGSISLWAFHCMMPARTPLTTIAMQETLKYLKELLEQKHVRFILALVCTVMALQSFYVFANYKTEADFLRGLGGMLLWGGFTAKNFSIAGDRPLPRVNLFINVGIALVISSWFVS